MMDEIKALYEKYTGLLTAQTATYDLQIAINEIVEIIESQEFKKGIQNGSIPVSLVGKFSQLEDDIKNKIDEIDHQNQKFKQEIPTAYDPKAQKLMDEADDYFWKGKWKYAYELYEQVLEIQPNWARALDYSAKAKHNYDNNIGIPKTAIPDSVKFPFFRAESALSRWELEQAKVYVEIAKSEITKANVGRFDELNALSFRIENYLEIHKRVTNALSMPDSQVDDAIEIVSIAYEETRRPVYMIKTEELKEKKQRIIFDEGLSEFRKGNLDLAIEKGEIAASLSEESTYKVQVTKWHELKKDIEEFYTVLATEMPTAEKFLGVKTKLARYLTQYGEISNLISIKQLLDLKQPAFEEFTINEINTLRHRSENSKSIESAVITAMEAESLVIALQDIGSTHVIVPKLKTEISKLLWRLQEYENLLEHAESALQSHSLGTSELTNLLDHIRKQFPQDPKLTHLIRRISKQEYDQLIRPAEVAISNAQFEKSLEILEKAQVLFQFPSDNFDSLVQFAQTNLSLQKKYYELMGRGRHFMDIEDYESAMAAFHEADDLVQNSIQNENLLMTEESS